MRVRSGVADSNNFLKNFDVEKAILVTIITIEFKLVEFFDW